MSQKIVNFLIQSEFEFGIRDINNYKLKIARIINT